MENIPIRRGDIYYADFGEAEGSAMQGRRPALIISNNKGNENSPVVIVAAITSSPKAKHLPTHLIMERRAGLWRKSMLLLEQICTMDKSLLGEKLGQVSEDFLKKVDRALGISVGLDSQYNSVSSKH